MSDHLQDTENPTSAALFNSHHSLCKAIPIASFEIRLHCTRYSPLDSNGNSIYVDLNAHFSVELAAALGLRMRCRPVRDMLQLRRL